MRSGFKWLLVVMLFGVAIMPHPVSAHHWVVVASPGMERLDPEAVRAFYLGQDTFANDVRVVPLLYMQRTEIQQQFFSQVLNTTEGRFQRRWMTHVFRQGGVPPQRVQTVDQMVELLKTTPGAIGLLPVQAMQGVEGLMPIMHFH